MRKHAITAIAAFAGALTGIIICLWFVSAKRSDSIPENPSVYGGTDRKQIIVPAPEIMQWYITPVIPVI